MCCQFTYCFTNFIPKKYFIVFISHKNILQLQQISSFFKIICLHTDQVLLSKVTAIVRNLNRFNHTVRISIFFPIFQMMIRSHSIWLINSNNSHFKVISMAISIRLSQNHYLFSTITKNFQNKISLNQQHFFNFIISKNGSKTMKINERIFKQIKFKITEKQKQIYIIKFKKYLYQLLKLKIKFMKFLIIKIYKESSNSLFITAFLSSSLYPLTLSIIYPQSDQFQRKKLKYRSIKYIKTHWQMHQSKNSIATNYIKKKDLTHITPFDSYNSLTKQRNPAAQTYLTSSRKKSNRSFLDLEQRQNVNNHICLQHSLPVAFVCFKCNFSLICSQCSKDSHLSQPQHDIRSLEKSSIFVKNNLIKSQIRLESKSNLLTKINEQIKQKKIELFTEKNDYKQQLQKTFDYIHQLLNQKLRQMSDQIEDIYFQNDKKLADTLSEIKSLQDYLDKCQQSINHWLQSTTQSKNDFPLCTFYSQKKDVLEDIVKQSELQQFQKQIYELKYKIQTSQINSIISLLNDLEVKYDIKQIYSSSIEEAKQSKPSSLSKNMISKVKSENELKIKPSKKKFKKPIRYIDLQKTEKISFPDTRLQKTRQSHKINGTFCTSTPKEGVSRQKKLQFFKKSPDCLTFMLKKRKKSVGKMISMPASPAKDQKQEKFSPSNKVKDFLFEGMKKKTGITKKKK